MAERLLTQGIYGGEFRSSIGPFGLTTGQMHTERWFGHNAGWYNGQGERLGWGDLSPRDIKRIRDEIPESEVFIVLTERNAFWQFTIEKGPIGSMAETREKIEKPGIGYVAQKARFIITRGTVYGVEMVDDFERDIAVKGLSRQDAVNLLIPPSER